MRDFNATAFEEMESKGWTAFAYQTSSNSAQFTTAHASAAMPLDGPFSPRGEYHPRGGVSKLDGEGAAPFSYYANARVGAKNFVRGH